MSSLADFFADITESFSNLFHAIIDIPGKILDGIKSFFIPEDGVVEEKIQGLNDSIKSKFDFSSYDLNDLFQLEKEVDDVNASIPIGNLGNFNVKILDSSYLKQGVSYFRPFIRGFIVLLCVFFNITQAMALFGLNSGEAKGIADNLRSREERGK